MNNKLLTIIGTSRITEHHIISAKNNGFKIIAISSTRKKSKFLKKLSRKFNIKKIFFNYKEAIKYTEHFNNAAYVITCKTSDNFKVLKHLKRSKKKILIEKPIFENFSKFKRISFLKKKIFTAYNRMYYQNVFFLRKKLTKKKNLLVRATIPENTINEINKNSCHIISILFALFNNIKIIKIIKNKNHIICHLSSTQGKIILFFNFNSSENTEIIINDSKIIYKLCPLEKLTIFNKIKISEINGIKYYSPKIFKIKNEEKFTKAGFYNQYKFFYKFIKDTEKPKANLELSKKIIDICNKISNS
jgi:hypothetical protein